MLEGDSEGLIIERVGDAEVPVVATISTTDGTATGKNYTFSALSSIFKFFLSAGEDYFRLDMTQVVFRPGEFTKTVTLHTITNITAEGDEGLTATVTAADSRVAVTEPVATIIITEDGSVCVI